MIKWFLQIYQWKISINTFDTNVYETSIDQTHKNMRTSFKNDKVNNNIPTEIVL